MSTSSNWQLSQYPDFRDTFSKQYTKPNVAQIHVDSSGRVFVKAFVLNPRYNKWNWKVDESFIPYAMQQSVGHPLTLKYYPDTETFDHPVVKGATLSIDRKKQWDYAVGHLVYPFPEPDSDHNYYGAYEITDPEVKKVFTQKGSQASIPFFTSACIAHDRKEDPNNIRVFSIEHNTITDYPAFGDVARITGVCEGDYSNCLNELKNASFPPSSEENKEGTFKDRCGYCPGGVMEKLIELNQDKTEQLLSISNPTKNASYIVRYASENLETSLSEQDTKGKDTPAQGNNPAAPKAAEQKPPVVEGKTDFTKLNADQIQEFLKKSVDDAVTKATKDANDRLERMKSALAGEKESKQKELSEQDKATASQIRELQTKLEAAEQLNQTNAKKIAKAEAKEKREAVIETLMTFEGHFYNNGKLDEGRFEKAVDSFAKRDMTPQQIKEEIETTWPPIPVISKASAYRYFNDSNGLSATDMALAQGYSAPPIVGANVTRKGTEGREDDTGEDNLEEDDNNEQAKKVVKTASFVETSVEEDIYIGLANQVVRKTSGNPFATRSVL